MNKLELWELQRDNGAPCEECGCDLFFVDCVTGERTCAICDIEVTP